MEYFIKISYYEDDPSYVGFDNREEAEAEFSEALEMMRDKVDMGDVSRIGLWQQTSKGTSRLSYRDFD